MDLCIGIIFIIYAISKWFRIAYTVTEEKVLETIEHYAFYRKKYREIKYDVQEIKISQTILQEILGYWKIEIISKNKNIVLETTDKGVVNILIKIKIISGS